uniref:Uncharacterized protein n=1 Tax=Knipowitschia caucasica TaxID=637954 RepID=A0AAV2JQI9_KNICA
MPQANATALPAPRRARGPLQAAGEVSWGLDSWVLNFLPCCSWGQQLSGRGAGTSWHPQCPIRTVCSPFSSEGGGRTEGGGHVKGRPATSSLTGHPCHDMTWPLGDLPASDEATVLKHHTSCP